MKVSDYIVEFLIKNNITDVFGYPGGMVTHLISSFQKYNNNINAHINYHEQASSFCACGYGQIKNVPGVAYATSGPGATNLLTGIANAYFDSISTIFFTGQVNTYESKGNLKLRQKGFQETDIVKIVKPIVKYAKHITSSCDIAYELEKAYQISINGRKGPVLLDIPMDVFKADIDIKKLRTYHNKKSVTLNKDSIKIILDKLLKAKKPLIIAGAGINENGYNKKFKQLVEKLGIPVVTSMIGIDLQNANSPYNFGFIGNYGHRFANFLIEKSDLILTLGTRLDSRQTGTKRDLFAKNAQIIRIDIDKYELENKVKENEIQIVADIKDIIDEILKEKEFSLNGKYNNWLEECRRIKKRLETIDCENGNVIVKEISNIIGENVIITTDVGQNQVWVAQSFKVKEGQRILFSGGHGAMGYSIPSAIGAYYASKLPIICFCGDGGLQMNIQELQFIAREKLPIKIIVFNNKSLGMIRHFQEMYFNSCFAQTTEAMGYKVPDFCKIAYAYGINSMRVTNLQEQLINIKEKIEDNLPVLIQIEMEDNTYVYPKLAINRPTYDQEPRLDKEIIDEILNQK